MSRQTYLYTVIRLNLLQFTCTGKSMMENYDFSSYLYDFESDEKSQQFWCSSQWMLRIYFYTHPLYLDMITLFRRISFWHKTQRSHEKIIMFKRYFRWMTNHPPIYNYNYLSLRSQASREIGLLTNWRIMYLWLTSTIFK